MGAGAIQAVLSELHISTLQSRLQQLGCATISQKHHQSVLTALSGVRGPSGLSLNLLAHSLSTICTLPTGHHVRSTEKVTHALPKSKRDDNVDMSRKGWSKEGCARGTVGGDLEEAAGAGSPPLGDDMVHLSCPHPSDVRCH